MILSYDLVLDFGLSMYLDFIESIAIQYILSIDTVQTGTLAQEQRATALTITVF